MQKYVTVSAKISLKLRQRLRHLKVKPSLVIKRALEEELKKEQAADIRVSVAKIQKILKKIPIEDAVRSIREDRDSR